MNVNRKRDMRTGRKFGQQRNQNLEPFKRKWDDQSRGPVGTIDIPGRDEHQGIRKWASEFRIKARHYLHRAVTPLALESTQL